MALSQTYDATDISVYGKSRSVILPPHIHGVFLRLRCVGLGRRVGVCPLIETDENADDLFLSIFQAVTAESNLER